MAKPVAIFVGFIGKLPMAGMALANLHMIAGLQALGYDVHYVERQNDPLDCYDPDANEMTDDPSHALDYLATVLPEYGIQPDRYSFIDLAGNCHGSGWPSLRRALDRADFVLTLADATWFDELGRCPRRAYLDADPLFTQVALQDSTSNQARALAHYDTLFTYGVRMGQEDCAIPTAGRRWLPARMAIHTDWWEVTPASAALPITNLMNWSSGSELVHEGRTYGYKSRELERFIDLPQRAKQRFALAVGGNAPRARLESLGWDLKNPLTVTKTVAAYQRFIAESSADLGIAKHAYVASRSGWFSDRSTCYLASGRPVLHQDTGFGAWLPEGEGVLPFSDMNDLLAAIERLKVDYDRHARAARAIAEEYFEASKAIAQILDDANFR